MYSTIFIFLLMVMMNNSANAEEVTCQEQELTEQSNVQILMGHPGINPPYTSGHVLVFKCTDVNMKMYGQRAINCQSNGKWDNPYPKCGETKCLANLTNMIVEVNSDPGVLYKPGDRVKVSCVQGRGLILQGQDDVTCQADGEWSGPFPSCIIQSQTTCGPPPNLIRQNADTVEMLKKTQYIQGEEVKYTCFKTYVLEGEPYMTCDQGSWRGDFTCVEPCSASVEEMDKRNIELQVGGSERLYCPHLDHVTFVCKRGKKWNMETLKNVHVKNDKVRLQCVYGRMTLPECE